MADILIDQPPPADGTACFERPQHVGTLHVNFDDLSDTWIQRFLPDGNAPLGAGLLILPGDVLEFDLKLPATSPVDPADQFGLPDITDGDIPRPVGIDMKFIGGPYFSDYDLVDARGFFVANGDRRETADQVWQRVSVSLSGYAGLYLRACMLTDEGEPAGTRRVTYWRRILLLNSGAIRFTFWNGNALDDASPTTDFWSIGSGGLSFSLLDVGIEGPIVIFGTVTADGFIGPYTGSPVRVVITGSSDNITLFDSTVLYNKSGSITALLPEASGIDGREFTLKNIHASGTVTVDAQGSETIDGSTTYSLSSQWDTVTVRAYGGNWITV